MLCGGNATRLGGIDKPLLPLGDRTLLEHVLDRIGPQVATVLLSCARTGAGYEAFGYPVIEDEDDSQGPLGGFVSALAHAQTPWLLTTPADTPFLPEDLVASLAGACLAHGAAVVTADGHRQNLAMLLDTEHAQSLAAFYQDGGRAIHRWLAANAITEVELPPTGFLNVNTPADFARAKRLIAAPD